MPLEQFALLPAQEESPLKSSIGQAGLTTENPRTPRKHETIRGLSWSTRPDSNWRPSRWQEKPNPKKINRLRLSHRREAATSGDRMKWRRHTAPRRHHRAYVIDSTGLSIVGEGEWVAAKYGGRGRRGWKKLHIGVDRIGMIVAEILTNGDANDGRTALDLIDEVKCDITSITADTAYDTLAIYEASAARGVEVVVPPSKSATRSRQRRSRSSARDRTIMRVKEIGRRRWKKESGYHHQARVENTFFRYKTIIGDKLRARHPRSQKAEVIIACNVLNQMTGLGMPESFEVGA